MLHFFHPLVFELFCCWSKLAADVIQEFGKLWVFHLGLVSSHSISHFNFSNDSMITFWSGNACLWALHVPCLQRMVFCDSYNNNIIIIFIAVVVSVIVIVIAIPSCPLLFWILFDNIIIIIIIINQDTIDNRVIRIIILLSMRTHTLPKPYLFFGAHSNSQKSMVILFMKG